MSTQTQTQVARGDAGTRPAAGYGAEQPLARAGAGTYVLVGLAIALLMGLQIALLPQGEAARFLVGLLLLAEAWLLAVFFMDLGRDEGTYTAVFLIALAASAAIVIAIPALLRVGIAPPGAL